MCRLLGYTSPNPTTFNDVVGKNFDQFVNLANDHCDGWGIATTSNHKADLYKEPVAATKSALQISLGSCSTHPGAGKCCGKSWYPRPRTRRSRSMTKAVIPVVPASTERIMV